MRKLILRNFQSPGDIVMLTAAVRDLHRAHPAEFLTDVRTSAPALWLHNPHLTPLDDADPDVEIIDCHYPLIHQSNTVPAHFLHGFPAYLNELLGTRIRVTEFKGDIHLSSAERAWTAAVSADSPDAVPYWLLVSGGKFDYTIKWWSVERYQRVIDHFRGRIQFVQVGEAGHHHPPLQGVVDLRGQTDLRQLVLLVHRAQGVVSPVSLLMHLAAAVELPEGSDAKSRPCIVIAGGREPPHFSAYPNHQFIHTIGALKCCETGGCWKSRTLPIGDGDPKDAPGELCVDVVDQLPRCMDMIGADEVIRRIELYFSGGQVRYLESRSPVCIPKVDGHGRRALGQN